MPRHTDRRAMSMRADWCRQVNLIKEVHNPMHWIEEWPIWIVHPTTMLINQVELRGALERSAAMVIAWITRSVHALCLRRGKSRSDTEDGITI